MYSVFTLVTTTILKLVRNLLLTYPDLHAKHQRQFQTRQQSCTHQNNEFGSRYWYITINIGAREICNYSQSAWKMSSTNKNGTIYRYN